MEKTEEDKGRAGKCEMRKRVGGQEDVSEANSWEKLHGVRPGQMILGGPLARTERSSGKSRRSCRCNKKQM